ncbi:TonB-dependent receptor [Polaribacter sp. IC066]|nr:TonB-dependent receptor [Polaribacter sp. IC066]
MKKITLSFKLKEKTRFLFKNNLKMKLTVILLFLSVLHLFPNDSFSQKKVTLNLQDVTLKKALSEIKKQTNFKFLYRNKEIDIFQKVTLKTNKESILTTLKTLFKNTSIDFKVIEKQIILTKRELNPDETSLQNIKISGTIKDKNGDALFGANVIIKGTKIGATVDFDGNFTLNVPEDSSKILVVSYLGFKTKEIVIGDKTTFAIVLEEDANQLEGVVLIGSRGKPRTQLESVAPIDVIGAKAIEASPQAELSQLMQFVAPSFHSTKQNIGHGSDHIDPMSLRGLGADQTLVLINGKRRHATALMNVNGTVGRGQVGTDLNSIPMAAIERIEVLRDGASAQYGSDAIAGVINIILKKTPNAGIIKFRAGFLSAPPEAPSFLEEFNPYSNNPDLASTRGDGGGENFQFSANYGVGFGEKGGFLNVTMNYLTKNPFNRMDDYTIQMFSDERRDDPIAEYAAFNQSDPAAIAAYNDKWGSTFGFASVNELSDFNGRRVANMGGSGTTNAGIMFNSELPFTEETKMYAFGGYNYRLGTATGFVRRPNQGARQSGLHPLGFSPHIGSDIQDISAVVGLETVFDGWDVDFSNTFGSNSFQWTIYNSNNASLFLESPTTFDAGNLKYSQNVINLGVSKGLDVGFPLNAAFGTEFRLENFQQTAGQDESWKNYDEDASDGLKESGSQVFPGYQRINQINKNRFNLGLYADFEAEFTDKFLVTLAGRYEDYSDFGNNFSWKLGSRYKITDDITIRGTYSTGFRAPSLPQKYFSSYTLQFITLADGSIDGVNIAHLNDDSPVTRQFGIQNLKPETSTNLSIGFTAKLFEKLSVTVDAYQVNIKDRIGITGRFNGGQDPRFKTILDNAGLSQVQFMTNVADTETNGLDVVLAYKTNLGAGKLTATAAGNFTKTALPRNANGDPGIKTGSFLEGFERQLFNREEVSRLEVAQPTSKIIVGLTYEIHKFTVGLNTTKFGEVTYVHPNENEVANAWNNGALETLDQVFASKILTDLNISYKITESINIGVGGANIFNVYPDRHQHSANYGGGMFGYSRRVSQFGLSGASWNANLSFKF